MKTQRNFLVRRLRVLQNDLRTLSQNAKRDLKRPKETKETLKPRDLET